MRAPRLLRYRVGQPSPEETRALGQLVRAYRNHAADGFVFLSGGATRVTDAQRAQLLSLFDAFRILVERGRRFAVGDGGTRTGIMEAAGLARARSGGGFPLLGVAPAAELEGLGGRVAVDPDHSDILAVHDPDWDGARGHFGSETRTMYEVFARLTEGQVPSVTLVANGGFVTLDEVAMNIVQRRRVVAIRGSGRAADAVLDVAEDQPTAPARDAEAAQLRLQAIALDVRTHASLFTAFPVDGTPEALADLIDRSWRRAG